MYTAVYLPYVCYCSGFLPVLSTQAEDTGTRVSMSLKEDLDFVRGLEVEKEVLDIEEYLEGLKYWRAYITTHVNFMEAMKGMMDTPVQSWEYQVSAYFRERVENGINQLGAQEREA